MDNNKGSVVDEFLNRVNNALPEKEENPFANLQVEQKEVPVVEEQEEKPVAYHEDPKLRRYIEKEIEKATKDLTPREETKFREEVKKTDFVSAIETVIGNDTPDKVNALNALRKEIDELRQEARSAKDMLEAEKQADLQAEQELAQGFESIEDTFNVDFRANSKLRSDFVEFIERLAPKGSDGEIREYPDFQETFKLFQELNKKPNTRAKELASRGMQRGGEASNPPMPIDTSWKGVEKFFSTLISK